jgi:hypothetical protein
MTVVPKKETSMKRFIFFGLCGLLTAGLFADAKGDEIAKANLDRKTPNDMTSVATMTITDRSGVVKTRKLKMVSKETAEGTKAYVEFVEPADVNGTKFLTVSKQGSETDQRLYLPALKKIRKISSSSKDGEFVGSDLFYFDMEKRYFEDGEYTFLSDNETLPGPAFAGMKFSKISITFKNPNAPYSKTIAWINPQDNIAYQAECYDKKDGALLKTISTDEVTVLKGYSIAVKTTVTNHKKGSHTQMVLGNLEVDSGVKDGEVSVKKLEQ